MPLASSLSANTFLTHRLYKLLAVLLLLALALVFHLPSLTWLPRGIHEWAQADRLALAVSFYDHGMNFFRPQTFNITSIDGVVGVEFPLIPYVAALAGKLTGRGSIVLWFRALTVGTTVWGCYYLFLLVFERTKQFVAALLPGVFLATSPVFAYYAGNFLPDPVGVAITLVAFYYLMQYQRHATYRHLVLGIGLFTLASLTKTSSAIYLVAAIGAVLFWSYLSPSVLTLWQKIGFLGMCAFSVAAIGGYILFNRHLNETYGATIFLAKAMPFENQQQYDMVWTRIVTGWWYEYFTKAHYIVLQLSAVICLVSLPRIIRRDWFWMAQLLLAAVGGWMFFRLMGLQFADHDYYVLAPFWPALTLLVALAVVQAGEIQVANLRWNSILKAARYIAVSVALIVLVALALQHHRRRISDPYRPFSDYYTYRWMQGGAQDFSAAKIPEQATLLVLGEAAPNLSLVYFDRRGIVWNFDMLQTSTAQILEKMTALGLDHLLMRQEVYQQMIQTHPDLLASFTTKISNQRYAVLARNGAVKHW
jgi:4-amino-4-deoxy-L-arabinose transferase-like glycosyltransferase